MRHLWLAVLLVGVLLPVIALSAGAHGSAHSSPATAPASGYARELLLLSAIGLRVSPDGGSHWRGPSGLPPGSFYSIVADATRFGAAFMTNGDVYSSTNGGYQWERLSTPPRALLGPAGITVLAGDPDGSALYAGSAEVLAYLPRRHSWQVWGQRWPHDAQPAELLAVSDHGLYAAAGGRFYHAANGTAAWQPITAPAWHGAPITAMALGPDGETAYAAVLDHGVWSIGPRPQPLGDGGLPAHARVYTLQSDPLGNDLYAATSAGLYVRHLLAGSAANATTWRRAINHTRAPIVALRPLNHGQGMLAVTRDGVLYHGTRAHGQSFSWDHGSLSGEEPLVAALTGAEWQGVAALPPLPAQFKRCLRIGPSPDRAFDVCGPFAAFYLRYGQSAVLGYPRESAVPLGGAGVTQLFSNVQLAWTPRQGAFLAPLGLRAAGHRVFPHPTPQQIASVTTPYLDGYYVDPVFDQFWRQYLNPPGSGASIFGPPISQVLWAASTDGTGRRVQVQYFRNARLEYHPDRPLGNRILLSSLGG